MVELEGEQAAGGLGGRAGGGVEQQAKGAGAHFGFDAPAADRAQGLAVAQDEHDGAGLLGGAAAGAHERADGDGFAGARAADDFL